MKRLLVILVPVFLSACSTMPHVPPPEKTVAVPKASKPQQNDRPAIAVFIEDQLLNHYQHWQGTPYRMGGNTPSGVDCSGYTAKVYKELFGMALKRRAAEQRTQGTRIKKSNLRAGDLVFFKPPRYADHVGVALGDGRFIHASSSQGVTISSLDEKYWKKSFVEARRLLQ